MYCDLTEKYLDQLDYGLQCLYGINNIIDRHLSVTERNK